MAASHKTSNSCPVQKQKAYKSPQSPAVYFITKDCTKRPIKNPDVYFTYFDSWGAVNTVSKQTLASIKKDKLGFMPWGPKWNPKEPALVKTVNNPNVYLVLNNKKYTFSSGKAFKRLGYKFNWIHDVGPRFLNNLKSMPTLGENSLHPDNSLIRIEGSNKVYLIQNGQKRWIKTQKALKKRGLKGGRIAVIAQDKFSYPEGQTIPKQDKIPENSKQKTQDQKNQTQTTETTKAVEKVSKTPDKTINLNNYQFSQQSPTFSTGTVVQFSNMEGTHTVTLEPANIDTTLSSGDNVTLQFNQKGTYQVYCRFHGSAGSGMHSDIQIGQNGDTSNTNNTQPEDTDNTEDYGGYY